MPRSSGSRPYRWLALCYDQLFLPFRSPLDRARRRILGPLLSQVTAACDLACGTGTTALALARRGIRMYGIDLSPGMCRLARAKARRAGLPLRVMHAGMQKFRLPEPVDLVLCEGDALNHVPRKADLLLVAKSVARALRPGGRFYCDVNNRRGFERYWTLTQWMERPGIAMVMRCSHVRGRDRAQADIEWFLRDGNLWRRRHEHVEEVCWSREEIRLALREAGFDCVLAWDAAPFFGKNSPVRPGCRTIYLARKSPR